MFFWCALLFVLGILAFMDSLLNYGEIFRTVNSVLFMLLSLGLLVRTTTKAKARKIEGYEARIYNLEQQIANLKQSQKQLSDF